jgi:ligand-binding sensor domain-containing protein
MKRIIFYILFSFFSFLSFSQEIVYKQYSSENGLISSYITQAIQDDNGYIWLSTNNGISRFDGYTFENFNINDKLPENDIVGMYKTSNNTLWFLSRIGLLSYFKNGKIYLYPFNDKILSLLKDDDFIEPRSLIVTNSYIEFNVFEHARYKIDLQGNITKLYDVSNKINIVDTRNKYLKYFINSQIQDFKIISKKGEESLITIPIVPCNEPTLCTSKNNKVYIANQNNLFVIENGILTKYSYDNVIISLQIDIQGDLWIGFKSEGVFCYKNSELKPTADYRQLKGNSVSSVIRDKQNSLWISSTNGGVFYLPSELFKQVTTKDGLIDNTLTQLDFSNNYLWAITGNNAIARLNFQGVKNYKFNNTDFSTVTDVYWYNNRLWLSFKNKITYFEGEEFVELFRLKNNIGSRSIINRIDA